MTEKSAWQIVVSPRAQKELTDAPPADERCLRAALDALSAGPQSGDVRKLHGSETE